MAFGIETNTFLGVLGDDVLYNLTVEPPKSIPGTNQVVARVVADTGKKGFQFGERLVYDWVFISTERAEPAGDTTEQEGQPTVTSTKTETEVSVNLFVQVNSVLYLPIWDAMQKSLTEKMMVAFERHAKKLKAERDQERGADGGGGGAAGGVPLKAEGGSAAAEELRRLHGVGQERGAQERGDGGGPPRSG